MKIAIDGPAGAGKSTVSNALSHELGIIHFDTGALYRAFGFYFVKNNLDFFNENTAEKNLGNIKIEIKFEQKIQKIFLGSSNVTEDIRTKEVSAAASKVSSFSCVREFLLREQQEFALKNDVIMDGRDIGTVIMPFADHKFFLTAALEIRAKRRFDELRTKDTNIIYEDVFESIRLRDKNDSERENCPLKAAKDAKIIDTSEMPFNYVVTLLKQKILSSKR